MDVLSDKAICQYILLDVDGDSFKRKKTISINKSEKPDFEKLAEEKRKETAEPIEPVKKTLEEMNAEALRKGLMVSGRGSERVLRKF
jgi:DNA transposition AAA+ family ATPase